MCVLVRLSLPVQVIDWKDSVSEMTYNVLVGTLNPTHPLCIEVNCETLSYVWCIIRHCSNFVIC